MAWAFQLRFCGFAAQCARGRRYTQQRRSGLSSGISPVVEFVCRAFLHAQALHDGARAGVAQRRHRDDLFQAQGFEAGAQGHTACLAGQAQAPETPREPPAHFHARAERKLRVGNVEAGEAGELRRRRAFRQVVHGPESPAALVDLAAHAVYPGVALLTREHGRKVAHDLGIGRHGGKGFAVGVLPRAQSQARAGQQGRCDGIAGCPRYGGGFQAAAQGVLQELPLRLFAGGFFIEEGRIGAFRLAAAHQRSPLRYGFIKA